MGDLLHSISADVSEAAPQLLEDLLPQIKHAKEAVRCCLHRGWGRGAGRVCMQGKLQDAACHAFLE